MTFNDLWVAISPVAGGLAALWGFFKLSPAAFAEKGFGHFLETRLASLKSEQDQDKERLIKDLEHIRDRGIRSNEREYKAVADAWEAYMQAHEATTYSVTNFTRRADLTPMSIETLTEYLDETDAHHSYKEAIVSAMPSARNQIFGRYLNAKRTNDAGRLIADAFTVSRLSSVFMPASLYDLFIKGLNLMHSAYVERTLSIEGDQGAPKDSSIALVTAEGAENLEKVREAVRERLHR